MDVIENPGRHRFELRLDDGSMALADYIAQGDRLVLTHTEVPPQYEGKGVGSRLARGVFDQARASGRTLMPLCSFMVAYARRHPEYGAVLPD